MTLEEFIPIVKQMDDIWNSRFEETKIATWHKILGNLKREGLSRAIQALSIEVKYTPSIKEIVDKYDELKRKLEKEILEQQIAQQQKQIADTVRGQFICAICSNTGDVFFDKDGYEYYLRCSCAHGRDLNKWSKNQLTLGATRQNPSTGKEEDLYVLDINDFLTEEEIEIIKIRNSGDKRARAAELKGWIKEQIGCLIARTDESKNEDAPIQRSESFDWSHVGTMIYEESPWEDESQIPMAKQVGL